MFRDSIDSDLVAITMPGGLFLEYVLSVLLINQGLLWFLESWIIPPICLSWKVLFGEFASSFGKLLSVFVFWMESLLRFIWVGIPSLFFAMVLASYTLMSLCARMAFTSLLVRILMQLWWKVG